MLTAKLVTTKDTKDTKSADALKDTQGLANRRYKIERMAREPQGKQSRGGLHRTLSITAWDNPMKNGNSVIGFLCVEIANAAEGIEQEGREQTEE
jgi:hypothetical protein